MKENIKIKNGFPPRFLVYFTLLTTIIIQSKLSHTTLYRVILPGRPKITGLLCHHSSLFLGVKEKNKNYIRPANVVRQLSGTVCVCVCVTVFLPVCSEPKGAVENVASFRSAHIPVICF